MGTPKNLTSYNLKSFTYLQLTRDVCRPAIVCSGVVLRPRFSAESVRHETHKQKEPYVICQWFKRESKHLSNPGLRVVRKRYRGPGTQRAQEGTWVGFSQ